MNAGCHMPAEPLVGLDDAEIPERRAPASAGCDADDAYGDQLGELTEAECEVLIDGGVRLDAKPTGDSLAATTVQFAALVSTSLTTKEAAKRLGIPESRIRQMIARRTLYSVLLDGRRRILAFQFAPNAGLVPNIAKVNAALPEDVHPVGPCRGSTISLGEVAATTEAVFGNWPDDAEAPPGHGLQLLRPPPGGALSRSGPERSPVLLGQPPPWLPLPRWPPPLLPPWPPRPPLPPLDFDMIVPLAVIGG